MAKEINTQTIVFNPAARTLNFSAWTSFNIRKLVSVINDDKNTEIYAIGDDEGRGLASFSGTTLTLQFDTTSHNAGDRLTAIYDDKQIVSVSNSENIFLDTFATLDTNKWDIVKATGDIIQVDGNTVGSNYLVMSIDPLADDTESYIQTKTTFTRPSKALLVNPSASQRIVGNEFSIALASTENSAPSVSPVAITSISQAGSTLTITLPTNHGFQVGDRISTSGIVDSRLNYSNLVVATNTSPTILTCTANAAGNLPSITAGPFNTGFVHYRPTLDYIPSGISTIFENATANQFSCYIKNGGNSALPSGTIGGNHSISSLAANLTSTQTVAGQYNNINFQAPLTLFQELKEEYAAWLDKAEGSNAVYSLRVKREAAVPDYSLSYKLRLKIKANKSTTRPIAKIISAVKTGTTTATITTDVAHGLTTSDVVNIYGIRDQTNFPNLTAATAVASTPTTTTFTIVIGTASTTTSYSGYVSRVNGGITQGGAIAQVAQSVARTSNILTLIGSATWASLSVGDYVNLLGCRDNSTGADLGLDGSYRVVYLTGTTLNLEPIGPTPSGIDISTTNCGGGIIKRSDFRIHKISLRESIKNIVEVEGGNGNSDTSRGAPVNITNSPVVSVSTLTTLANGQTAHSSASTGSPVRVAGRVNTTADTTLVAGDASDLFMSTAGQLIIKPYATSELDWQYTATLTTNTATAMTAAGAASVRNYLTGLVYQNTSATATTILILDGATTIATFQANATMAMPVVITFPTPLRGTAATALNINCGTTGANVIVSSQGFKSF